ncbi:2'-5' RNA ligase family protein [Polymorphobacter sp.]|uniref:2'-5' RNA ligase family protein n=1 Tax=Polymorphobacter sp. TaxID=1909290 RepID=UPI003F71D4BC
MTSGSSPPDPRPLILTAGFDDAAQARLEGWRRAHYPAARNQVPAHLSLFRQLPGRELAEVSRRLARLTAETPPLPARFAGFERSEGGIVLRVEAPALLSLRDGLAEDLHGLLAFADGNSGRLQVTIQNKVDAATARASLAMLAGEPLPQAPRFVRLRLWRYLDGPWEALGDYPLRGRWRG